MAGMGQAAVRGALEQKAARPVLQQPWQQAAEAGAQAALGWKEAREQQAAQKVLKQQAQWAVLLQAAVWAAPGQRAAGKQHEALGHQGLLGQQTAVEQQEALGQ